VGLVQKTCVVIPCFNEEKRLEPRAFLGALTDNPELGFLFVNDGSTDATLALLNELARSAPQQIEVLDLDVNSGKAEAVRRGVLRAAERGARMIGYWDADLATPLRYIPIFQRLLEHDNFMLVLGSRVRMLGHEVRRSAPRHYLGRGVATLAAFALGLPVYDTQCGAKLFRTTPAMLSAFERRFQLGWSFDIEILARLLARQASEGDIDVQRHCCEVPLEEWIDAPGSKLTFAQFPRVGWELVRLFFIVQDAKRAQQQKR
jgi:glycosyltransferase involved in cell wall biosynthesis